MRLKDLFIYITKTALKDTFEDKYDLTEMDCISVVDVWDTNTSIEKRCVYDVYSKSTLDGVRIRLYCKPDVATVLGELIFHEDLLKPKDEIRDFYTAECRLDIRLYQFHNNEIRQDCPFITADVPDNIILHEEFPPLLLEDGSYILLEEVF